MRKTGLIILCLLVVTGFANAEPGAPIVQVQQTENLHEAARLSSQKALPILLVFSATHCPYCVMLEDEILKPMLISGDYGEKIIIRKINIDLADSLRDFDGKEIKAGDFVNRYNVFVTPTMLFLDSNGNELAKRMIGINTVEMFGGFVDEAIDQSIKMIRNKVPQDKLATAR